MSIYGDAEGGGESLTEAAAKGPQRPAIQLDMSDETKKKIGGVAGVCLVIFLIFWVATPSATPSASSCTHEEAAAAAARRMPTTTDADGTVHFAADGQLQKREHDAVTLPMDYQVKFTITPGPTVKDDWSNIIHFSATGDNCCNYGDRVPGVWFYPGKRQLHIIDGHGKVGSGNDECVIEQELVPGTPYNVQIDAHEHFVEVYINDVMECTEPRQDRRQFPTAKVYASDPWYSPADASLAGLQLKPLAPVMGCTDKSKCDYDVSASIPDFIACTEPRFGFCSGPPAPPGTIIEATLTREVSLISQPTRITRHAPLVHEARAQNGGLQGGGGGYQAATGALHAIVPLPMDYEVEFSITPDYQVQESWANIVHFTATMSNCCEYGDRLPGAHAFHCLACSCLCQEVAWCTDPSSCISPLACRGCCGCRRLVPPSLPPPTHPGRNGRRWQRGLRSAGGAVAEPTTHRHHLHQRGRRRRDGEQRARLLPHRGCAATVATRACVR